MLKWLRWLLLIICILGLFSHVALSQDELIELQVIDSFEVGAVNGLHGMSLGRSNNTLVATTPEDIWRVIVTDFEPDLEFDAVFIETDQIITASYLLDGVRLLTVYDDYSLGVWDIEGSREIEHYTGHEDAITSVARLSVQGFVTGSADGTVRLWQSLAEPRQQIIAQHDSTVTDIAISYTSDLYIASADENGNVHIGWLFEGSQGFLEFDSTITEMYTHISGGELYISTADGNLHALQPEAAATIEYEDEFYEIYQVPQEDGSTEEWALVQRRRSSAAFIDPENLDAGLIEWEGSWRALDVVLMPIESLEVMQIATFDSPIVAMPDDRSATFIRALLASNTIIEWTPDEIFEITDEYQIENGNLLNDVNSLMPLIANEDLSVTLLSTRDRISEYARTMPHPTPPIYATMWYRYLVTVDEAGTLYFWDDVD